MQHVERVGEPLVVDAHRRRDERAQPRVAREQGVVARGSEALPEADLAQELLGARRVRVERLEQQRALARDRGRVDREALALEPLGEPEVDDPVAQRGLAGSLDERRPQLREVHRPAVDDRHEPCVGRARSRAHRRAVRLGARTLGARRVGPARRRARREQECGQTDRGGTRRRNHG